MEYTRIYAHHQDREQWIWIHTHDLLKFKPLKIDPKKWYDLEGLWMGNEGWVDQWHNDEYDFPSTRKYFRWKKRHHDGFTKNKKLVSGHYELLYDKRQILAVKIILQHEKDERYFPKERRYVRLHLRKRLQEFHTFLRLYIAVEELRELSKERMAKKYKRLPKRLKKIKKEATAELRSYHKLTEQPRLEREARRLLKAHDYTIRQLHDWRFWLAQQSHLNEGSISRESTRFYLAALDEVALVKAEETNYMIWILNWLLHLLTGDVETVQNVLGSWMGPRCRFCHRAYIPRPNRRDDQETCGREECSARLRNLNRGPKRRKKTK